MKSSNLQKKLIGTFIILSFFVVPFLSNTKNIYAIESGSGVTSGSGFGNTIVQSGVNGGGAGMSGYISMVTPAIKQLPGCKKTLTSIGGKIKTLFKKAEDTEIGDKATDKLNQTLNTVSDRDKFTAVPIYFESGIKEQRKSNQTQKETEEKISQIELNQNCFNSIGKMIVKILVQKMTTSTIEWINGGYEGAPLFVTNPQKFLTDIAKSEILFFGSEISDITKYPFGKTFLQNTAINFNNKFQDNARYSLDEVIKSTTPEYSAKSFSNDFSSGGWGAWDALTQVPANNQIGFNIMASNELNTRLEGTTQSKAQEVQASLIQGGGFLGDEKCTDPWGVTKEESDFATKVQEYNSNVRAENDRLSATGSMDLKTYQSQSYNGKLARVCKKWEYVTPGSVISHTLTKKMDNTENSLLSSETLNDAMAAILDAVIAKFSSDLTEKGLAYMDTSTTEFYNNQTLLNPSQVELDFANPTGNIWLKQNPDFNIRTDLTQALIDEQKIFIEKLKAQNKELQSIGGASPTRYYGLLPTIYQLDYCIPGPHPGWEYDVQEAFKGKFEEPKIQGGIGQQVLDFFSMGFDSAWDQHKAIKKLAELLKTMTGVGANDDQITSMSHLESVVNTMVDRYGVIINDVFNPEILPTITQEANNEFEKTAAYRELMKKNDLQVIDMTRIIRELTSLKSSIARINSELSSGKIEQLEYEDQLIPIKKQFERISGQMVTGDDISQADDILKEIIDEQKYVYNELLKGPYGCEKELETNVNGMPWQLITQKRPTYPFPILYDYNSYTSNQNLPDPFNSGFLNKINSESYANTGRQGFLVFVKIDSANDWGVADQHNSDGSLKNPLIHSNLQVHDLFNISGYGGVWVDQVFEKTMRIY